MATAASVHFPVDPTSPRHVWLFKSLLVIPQDQLNVWDEVVLDDLFQRTRDAKEEQIEHDRQVPVFGTGRPLAPSTACIVIRTAMVSILGVPGQLSRKEDELQSLVTTSHLLGKVYFLPDEGTRYTYIDLLMAAERTSLSSHPSSGVRDSAFRRQVLQRDNKCLFTTAGEGWANNKNAALEVHACHIMPHYKGNEYMQALSRQRSDDAANIDAIDDVRNGMCLWMNLHLSLSAGSVAFLPLVDASGPSSNPSGFSLRLLYVGEDPQPPIFKSIARQGLVWRPAEASSFANDSSVSSTRTSSTGSSAFPPKWLFDILFASTLFQAFGKQQTAGHEYLARGWRESSAAQALEEQAKKQKETDRAGRERKDETYDKRKLSDSQASSEGSRKKLRESETPGTSQNVSPEAKRGSQQPRDGWDMLLDLSIMLKKARERADLGITVAEQEERDVQREAAEAREVEEKEMQLSKSKVEAWMERSHNQ